MEHRGVPKYYGGDFTDKWKEEILAKIEEYNIEGKPIYWKKLTEIFEGRITGVTMHNKIKELEEEGEIISIAVNNFKHLYVVRLGRVIIIRECLTTLSRTIEELLDQDRKQK